MAYLQVQNSTISLISSFEGFEEVAYWDFKQYSIGFGSGTMPNGQPVKSGDRVTRSQAEQMLKRDVQNFANSVNRLVTSNINQNQFDALVSFTYNLGAGNLQSSTLLKKINLNPLDVDSIRIEFMKWVNAGGKVIDNLVERRKKEAKLYASGISSAISTATNYTIWVVIAIAIILISKQKGK